MGGQGVNSPLCPSLDNSGKTPLNQYLKKKKEEKKKVGGVKIFKDREKENSFRKKPKTTTVSLKQNKIPVGTDKSVNIQSKLTPVEAYY